MNINYELYKNFYYVAKLGSVSKGAEKLGVTQSALSQSIKQLESLYEKNLFVRTSKGMVLTDEGKILYDYVETGVKFFDEGDIKLKEFDKLNLKQTLKIASSPTLAKMILFPKIKNIANENLQIFIKNFGRFNDRINAVRDGLADFAIVKDTKNFSTQEFEVVKLKTLNYTFFYNPDYYTIEDEITIDELSSYPLILKSPGTMTKQNLSKNSLKSLQPQIECEHDDMIIEIVKQGLGIGFAPQEYLGQEFKILKVKEIKSFSFNILALTRKDNKKIKCLLKLIED